MRLNALLRERVANQLSDGLRVPAYKGQHRRAGSAQADPQQVSVLENASEVNRGIFRFNGEQKAP